MGIPKQTAADLVHAITKGGLSAIPYAGGVAAELFGFVLASPLEKRKAKWMESVAELLAGVEAKLESMRDDPAFVTTLLQASSVAVRTHQEDKLEALRNAVVNFAIGTAPQDDLRSVFLNLIDSFTPTHLRILKFFQNPSSVDSATVPRYRDARAMTDLVINELARDGLIEDPRPYAARGRDTGESLLIAGWTVSNLGTQFIRFISSGV
jgi:hypothetical protein